MLSVSKNGEKKREYVYNKINNLMSSTVDGVTTTYAYNGDRLRESKTTNGVTTRHIYDGTDVVADVTGDTTTNFVRGIGLIYSENMNTGDKRKYALNAHGDVAKRINADGTAEKFNYRAYGIGIVGTPDPFGYCGEYTDSETGLIYLRNRYYDPELGRFINVDPIFSGANWYAYANCNPIKYIDPSGLDSYIIYDKTAKSGDGEHTMADEAEIRAEQLRNTWGTNVQVYGVDSAWEFKDVWDKRVGYNLEGYEIPIEEVIIVAHGSITGKKEDSSAQSYFYFEKDKSAVFAKDGLYSVEKLEPKTVEWLTFSTCNSGNPDVYNLAYAFKKKMNIKQYIVAWDGGTIFDYSTGQLLRGGYDSDNWIKDGIGQHTWKKYVDKNWYGKPNRKRIGYRQIPGGG